ncbi:MAG: type II toxin-antitoxin system HipA family toxin [Paludibacter sp.]|nr:type II toxin-antitoxin system HipA family toxin [Paludibacter sp.]
MPNIQLIEIKLSDVKVGRIALTPDNLCAFEYDVDYLRTGVSISPFYLPLQAGVFVSKRDPFAGNFGVFNDSLPDGWGSLLLDRYLTEQGFNPHSLNTLERLSLIGKTGRGGLEYYPENNIILPDEVIHLDMLAKEAEKLLQSDYTGGSLELLYRYGGSSGGARPKVFVKIEDGDWLIKFIASTDPDNVGEVEYKYSLLAKACGIDMPETKLFEGKYFGVRRFDRQNNSKQHVISAAGLLNADYRIPSLDYSILMTACLRLTRNMEEVYKLFKIMVFNVLIKNKDDHAKNFSFILIKGEWHLSPAYDLLPSNGFNGFHTTTVNGQGSPTQKDIMAVAQNIGLNKQRAKDIYEEIFEKCKEVR